MILWSGGCDSTWLLFEEAAKLPKGQPLRVLSVNHQNVRCSRIAARRKKIADFLWRSFWVPLEHIEVTVSATGGQPEFEGGLAQPQMWLAASVSYLKQDEDLMLGYIRGDDIWHYRSELLAAFASLQALGWKTGKLLFPLEWSSKMDVLKYLANVERGGRDLLSLCWYCEMRTSGEPCGDCPACRTHRMAMTELQYQKAKAPCLPKRKGRRDGKRRR